MRGGCRGGAAGGLGHGALERSCPPPAPLSASGKPGPGLRRATAADRLPRLAGPRASSTPPAGSPGLTGSKGRGPEGMPSSLCPGGQKRTAGRWDRPGPRPDSVILTFEISRHEQIQLRDTTENTFPDGRVSITGVVDSK
ncbi:hypothetical protein AB1E18_015436 [Capra hircus]